MSPRGRIASSKMLPIVSPLPNEVAEVAIPVRRMDGEAR